MFVDYHRPVATSPFRYLMTGILGLLEPFAMDLWKNEIASYLPPEQRKLDLVKTSYFGDLYQKIVITKL